MADEWTGLDLDKVRNQLNVFDEIMEDAISNYETTFYTFNNDLYRMWASERAVSFNGLLTELAYMIVRLRRCNYEVLTGCVRAAQYMAQHNGATFDYYVPELDEYYEVAKLTEHIDGIRGMNIPLARLALETYSDGVQEVINKIDSIPLDFALYDPAGELISAYKARVERAKNELNYYLNTAAKELNTAFEEEEMQVVLGKEKAQSALA